MGRCFLRAGLGFTFPNSTALGMSEQGKGAGSASALLGTLQYSLATISSVLVALLHDSGPGPMAAIIGGCGVLASCARHFIVPTGRAPSAGVVSRSIE